MLNKQNESKTMNDINETMDNAIRENDTNKIDDIVFNPKNVLIRVYEYNFDYNSGRYVDKHTSSSSSLTYNYMDRDTHLRD